jgi:hypothetical protein
MTDNLHQLNATKELLHDSDFYYLICVDNTGNYSYVNNHYDKTFSYIHQNLVGQPYYITMHPDDTRVCEVVGAQCFAHPGELFPATIRKHDRNQGYIFTQWEYILMVGDGQPQGIFCLGFDTTEYEKVKDKVEFINRDLEIKNNVLSNIAYEQSHIVRAPLANIMGLVSILKTLPHDEKTTEIIGMLEESSNKLDEVIKSIVKKTYDH